MYDDNPEITDAVAQLYQYFGDGSLEQRPEVRNFAAWVAKSIESLDMGPMKPPSRSLTRSISQPLIRDLISSLTAAFVEGQSTTAAYCENFGES